MPKNEAKTKKERKKKVHEIFFSIHIICVDSTRFENRSFFLFCLLLICRMPSKFAARTARQWQIFPVSLNDELVYNVLITKRIKLTVLAFEIQCSAYYIETEHRIVFPNWENCLYLYNIYINLLINISHVFVWKN